MVAIKSFALLLIAAFISATTAQITSCVDIPEPVTCTPTGIQTQANCVENSPIDNSLCCSCVIDTEEEGGICIEDSSHDRMCVEAYCNTFAPTVIPTTTAQITSCADIPEPVTCTPTGIQTQANCVENSPIDNGLCCSCVIDTEEEGGICIEDSSHDRMCVEAYCPTFVPTESPTNNPTVLPTTLEPTMRTTSVPTQQLTSTETTDLITTFTFSTATPTPIVQTSDFEISTTEYELTTTEEPTSFPNTESPTHNPTAVPTTSVPTQQSTPTETTDEISTTEEQKKKKKQWKKYNGKKSKKYKSKSGKKYKWKSKSKSSGIRKKKYYYLGHGNNGKTDKKCCECLDKQHFGGCEDRECERMICDTDPFCCYDKWDDMCAMKARAECKDELLPVCCDCSVPQRGKGCESDTLCEEMVCGKDSFCCEYKWDRRCANEATAKCKENAGHGTKQMRE